MTTKFSSVVQLAALSVLMIISGLFHKFERDACGSAGLSCCRRSLALPGETPKGLGNTTCILNAPNSDYKIHNPARKCLDATPHCRVFISSSGMSAISARRSVLTQASGRV
jgi:hypothetical protein